MAYLNKSEKIKEAVKGVATFINGEYNETEAGVPRIIVRGISFKMSIVYLANQNKWKVFYPFPSTEQKRKYFDNVYRMRNFLKEKGVKF